LEVAIHSSSSVAVDSDTTQDNLLLLLVTTAKFLTLFSAGDKEEKKASAYGRDLKDAARQLILCAPVLSLFRILECSPGGIFYLN
jgi:hypothetical protein